MHSRAMIAGGRRVAKSSRRRRGGRPTTITNDQLDPIEEYNDIPVPLETRPPAEIVSGELIVRRSDPTKVTSAPLRQGPCGGAFGV